MAEDACTKLPPVSSAYSQEGSWDTIANLKTYVTGPSRPKRALIFIYDVFGPASQTLQGADRLSKSLDAVVLVPDFFNGVYVQPSWMPADTEEKKAAFDKFRAEQAAILPNVGKLIELRKIAGERWPSVSEDSWGVFGLCWGGKIGVLVSGEGNQGKGRRFAASGTAHPS